MRANDLIRILTGSRLISPHNNAPEERPPSGDLSALQIRRFTDADVRETANCVKQALLVLCMQVSERVFGSIHLEYLHVRGTQNTSLATIRKMIMIYQDS